MNSDIWFRMSSHRASDYVRVYEVYFYLGLTDVILSAVVTRFYGRENDLWYVFIRGVATVYFSEPLWRPCVEQGSEQELIYY